MNSMRIPLAALAFALLLTGCSQEARNKFSRIGVTWLEGHYRVTFAEGAHVRSWEVRGKVTSEPDKGYYYFWAESPGGKDLYVQVPIVRTYIEELP